MDVQTDVSHEPEAKVSKCLLRKNVLFPEKLETERDDGSKEHVRHQEKYS